MVDVEPKEGMDIPNAPIEGSKSAGSNSKTSIRKTDYQKSFHIVLEQGKICVQLGWQEIDPLTSKTNSKNSSKENMLPNVSKGDGTTTKSADCKEGKTTPPSHYNEASLLTFMDTAGQVEDEKKVKRAMRNADWVHRRHAVPLLRC